MVSDSYECGYYSIINSSLRFQFNYLFILLHFIVYEQELVLALLLSFSIPTYTSLIVIGLLVILYIDILIDYTP